MRIEHKIDVYLGVVTNVIKQPSTSLKESGDSLEEDLMKDKDAMEHVIIAAVPGVYEHLRACPEKGSLDEPKIGDKVIIYVWDTVYNSYNTYRKLKENDIVGFRAHGKMVDVHHDYIKIGVFDETTEYKEDERPDTPISHIIMDKDGNIDVHASQKINVVGDSDCEVHISGNTKVTIDGNSEVTISGDSKVSVSGNLDAKVDGNIKVEGGSNIDIKSSGNTNIESSGNIDIKSSGTLTTKGPTWIGNNGTVAPATTGPFCGIPTCPLTGAPHAGNQSSGG